MLFLSRYTFLTLAIIIGSVTGLSSTTLAQGEPRIALLIGNQAYDDAVGSLKNPYNDVKLVAAALKSTGFSVTVLKDASRLKILTALRIYSSRLKAAGPDAVGFFYYSGHGASETSIGPNYLIPVNVKSTDDSSLWDASIRLNEIIKRLKRGAPAAAHFVVFDACRNELRTQDKSVSKGFVPEQSESGFYIAFATAQNRKASDQGEGSGPYAKALAEQIVQPGQHHMDMFFNVKTAVRRRIKQTPWDRNGLLRRIYFGGRPAQSGASSSIVPAALPGNGRALELAYWATVKTSKDPADFIDYITQFPQGLYVSLARRRAKRLEEKNTKLTLSTTPPKPQFDADYPFDGIWIGPLCSAKSRRMARVCKTRIARIEAGKLLAEWGRAGKPGSGSVKGQVTRDGRVKLTISGSAGQARIRGRFYIGHMSGRASRLEISASGKYTVGRGVSYNLVREGAPPPLTTASKFDGEWSVQKQFANCSPKGKGRLTVSIASGGVASRGLSGTIADDGMLVMNRTKTGARIAKFKGRIDGNFGSGTFEHENRTKTKTCRGTFSIVRVNAKSITPADDKNLAVNVQRELRRLGCYNGAIDGIWGSGSRAAIGRYNEHANAALTRRTPKFVALRTLEARQGRVCPHIKKQSAIASRSRRSSTKQTSVKRSSSSQSSCRLETRTECKRRVCPAGSGCGLKGTGICYPRNRRRICR